MLVVSPDDSMGDISFPGSIHLLFAMAREDDVTTPQFMLRKEQVSIKILRNLGGEEFPGFG